MQKAITEGISTSGGIRMTTIPKKSTELSTSAHPFSPLVAISVAEAELGGTFYNAKKGKVLHLKLEEMGWKQGPTTIFVDNNTASGICKSTIKRQQSRTMNGQYFWLIDQVNLNTYQIKWAPGLENMADYFTKKFAAAHHCIRARSEIEP